MEMDSSFAPIKEFLTLKSKYRHDGISDQFSRVIIVKMLLISAFIAALDLYNDHLSCFLTKQLAGKTKVESIEPFIESACWAQGLYIYKDLPPNLSYYHGVPKNLNHNGYDYLDLYYMNRYRGCKIHTNGYYCIPFNKVYYIQYQFFYYYLASLAGLYYLPYLLYRMINADLTNLTNSVDHADLSKDISMKFKEYYFDKKNNGGVFVHRVKVMLNLVVKLSYVVVNVTALLFTNYLLNGDFIDYGVDCIKWFASKQRMNGLQNDISQQPGSLILPTIGICDVPYSFKSITRGEENHLVLMCEISGHVVYRYLLFVLWIIFMAGILVSVAGLILHIIKNLKLQCMQTFEDGTSVCARFTLRELEYMKVIRNMNSSLYKEIIKILLQKKETSV